MRIEPMGLLYTKVKVDDCDEIVEKSIVGDEIIDRLVYHDNGVAYPLQADIPFYKSSTALRWSTADISMPNPLRNALRWAGISLLQRHSLK